MTHIEELHGIHAGRHEHGEIMERVRVIRKGERRREREEADRIVNRHGIERDD